MKNSHHSFLDFSTSIGSVLSDVDGVNTNIKGQVLRFVSIYGAYFQNEQTCPAFFATDSGTPTTFLLPRTRIRIRRTE